MSENKRGFLALLVLCGVLLLATAGCSGLTGAQPTPTTWYLVITNTPLPSPTRPVVAPPTVPPTPKGHQPTQPPSPTSPPTPPPLPTSPSTKQPTAPPPPPTPVPPSPTAAPTFTPVPPAPPQDVCKGDEKMTFEPNNPKMGEKLTIKVTSAQAHQNVRLEGHGNPGTPKVDKEGEKNIWLWTVTVSKQGRLSFTFYVGSTPCTANHTSTGSDASPPNVELGCAAPDVTGAPGETVNIMVTMKNTGQAQETFNVDISKSMPGGWQAKFCFGSDCHADGPVSRTLGSGASEQIRVEITVPAGASPGQKGSVTINVISQSDASANDSLQVSVTVP